MKKELTTHLARALTKLEKATAEVLKTQGYTKNAESLKILSELVKEQNPHAHTRSTTR